MGDTFNIEDESGIERLIGTIHDPAATVGDVLTVQADKSIAAQVEGGGSMPVMGQYAGSGVTVADGADEQLTWDTLGFGTELLDRTDPANPLFLSNGTYAVTVCVITSAPLTIGGFVNTALVLADAGAIGATTSEHPEGGGSPGGLILTVVGVVADNTVPLALFCHNADGAASRQFRLQGGQIVKLA